MLGVERRNEPKHLGRPRHRTLPRVIHGSVPGLDAAPPRFREAPNAVLPIVRPESLGSAARADEDGIAIGSAVVTEALVFARGHHGTFLIQRVEIAYVPEQIEPASGAVLPSAGGLHPEVVRSPVIELPPFSVCTV